MVEFDDGSDNDTDNTDDDKDDNDDEVCLFVLYSNETMMMSLNT